MGSASWPYRAGQAVGLWQMCVRERGVLLGTGQFVLVGFVGFVGAQVANDVQQVAEAET
jgi:hypothetical protein